MSWIKKSKQVIIYLSVTILFFGFFDFLLGQYLNDGVAYICRDEMLHHKYCPQSKRTYRMTEADGAAVINSYWNKDSVQVKNTNEMSLNTDFHQYQNILIGDSFVAQRQVLFEERMSSILNQRLGKGAAIQFGTGSWNMVTYTQAIKKIKPRKGQNIHIFLMANDFFSNGYGMSNAKYYEQFREKGPEEIFWDGRTETATTKFKRWLSNNSFSYQFFNFKNSAKRPNIYTQDSAALPLIELGEVQMDCGLLENYRNMLKNPITFSLVEHAFDLSCYNQEVLDNLIVLKELDIYLSQMAAKEGYYIYYYFIPHGSYKDNEAKEFKFNLGLNRNSYITNEGMHSAVEYTLNKSVVSLEKLFNQQKGASLLYYSHDGHWNSAGTLVVANKLVELLTND